MKQAILFFGFLLGITLLSTSCTTLPAGPAPVGNIVNSQIPKIKNEQSALNHMITSLIAFTATEIPGNGISAAGNDKTSTDKIIYILNEVGKTSFIWHSIEKTDYNLSGNLKKNSWHLTLYKNNKAIWEEKIIIEE